MSLPAAIRSGLIPAFTLGPLAEKSVSRLPTTSTAPRVNRSVARLNGSDSKPTRIRMPSLKLTICAGSVATPTDIPNGDGESGAAYTIAPTAPAAWALFNFISKLHDPRMITATRLPRPLAGSGSHASPVPSSQATSPNGAVTAPAGAGPLPGTAKNDPSPAARTPEANVRLFVVAPTAIADGAVAGEEIVLRPGPLLPAAAITSTPARVARSMAWTSISSSSRGARSSPRLRLITSMPSATASSIAFSTTSSVVPSLDPGVPNTL